MSTGRTEPAVTTRGVLQFLQRGQRHSEYQGELTHSNLRNGWGDDPFEDQLGNAISNAN